LVCDETVRRWTRQDLPTGPSVRRNAPRLGVLGSHFSLRPSAYLCVLCVNGNFNAEDAEIRRENASLLDFLCKAHPSTELKALKLVAVAQGHATSCAVYPPTDPAI
jgi:hypothetical protein